MAKQLGPISWWMITKDTAKQKDFKMASVTMT
jgi:hypothetical protein